MLPTTKPLVSASVDLEIKNSGGGGLDEKINDCQSLLNVNKQYNIIIRLSQRFYSCRSTILFICLFIYLFIYQHFRCSLVVGIFTSVLKISSIIIPVFKSGDPSNVNYRPISQ